ncbi:hypothetical protein B0H17DRAFT_406985 [Mycena rosella]|uniref:Uncharacterized protein n=1 Tax=Mycena rosella TaxID=1033263 RepID=A0AAD7GID0_MYCRO|nr:hypothetical protein B0H17DRAFT_406985 [Mycena rosella]
MRGSSRYGLIFLEALHIIDPMYPTICFSYLSPFLLALLRVSPHYFNVVYMPACRTFFIVFTVYY